MRKRKRKPKTVTIPRRQFSSLCPSSARFSALCLLIFGVLSFLAYPGRGAAWPIGARNSEYAQEKPYALIYGTVWGPDDRPVYGIKVKIRRVTEKKARWELYSDHSGEFAQRVPAGKCDYVVWADLKESGLAKSVKLQPGPEVTVHIENDERADIGVHLK
jgi:hypothetical protein